MTSATWMVPVPVGQPVADGGGGGATAEAMIAVGTDEAKALPFLFVACTLNRIVLPTSTGFSR